MYDYEASKNRLSARLKAMHDSEWRPTPYAKKLKSLADELGSLSKRLGDKQWFLLEQAHNADELKEIGLDGFPIEQTEPAKIRFLGLRMGMMVLAETARKEIQSLPNSRERPELAFAAEMFLHLRYQCGFVIPSLYNQSADVQELGTICTAAGIFRSPESLRGAPSSALKSFEPCSTPDGFYQILMMQK